VNRLTYENQQVRDNMKMLRKDFGGVAPVIEYLFAFTVFILVLSIYYTALGTLFPSYNTETTHLEEKCILISDSLLGNTGWIQGDTIPDGGSEHWEGYSARDINHASHISLASLGLCIDNSSYGVLDYDKIMALEDRVETVTFNEIFSLTKNLAVNISVRSTASDIIVSHFGVGTAANTRDMVTVERFCVITNNDARIMGKVTVKLFYGGV